MEIQHLSEQQLRDELAKRSQEKQKQKQAFKDLSNETIPGLFDRLKKWSDEGQELKALIYSNLKELIELKFDTYGIKSGQQSHTFTSDKGGSITIGYNVNAGYDDSVWLGVARVKEFINSQIKDDTTAKLVNQINRLLRPDKKGNLDPKRVLELKQMAVEFNNIDFIEGVEIIENSYSPKRSTWFIKANYTNNVGVDVSLPLSISSIDFPENFDLSFLITEDHERSN